MDQVILNDTWPEYLRFGSAYTDSVYLKYNMQGQFWKSNLSISRNNTVFYQEIRSIRACKIPDEYLHILPAVTPAYQVERPYEWVFFPDDSLKCRPDIGVIAGRPDGEDPQGIRNL